MHREGRFEKSMDTDTAQYTASLKDDIRIFKATVKTNKAHVKMLEEKEIINKKNSEKILQALSDLEEKEFEDLDLRPELEDIHMVIEEFVKDKVGENIGGKLHTAKSRNDQVSAAIRIVLREDILDIQELVKNLIVEMKNLAENNLETVMPGYTHLQVAEPTTFAHYLANYIQALIRNIERFDTSYNQTNRNPLGSCAFAGTSFDIDRELTRDLLGFGSILENTMDATGSRDFILNSLSNISLLMTDLSRFAEELILWNSAEFDMINIPEEFSSTSSIMPQKKNPVIPEIARAKCGQTVGNLVGGLEMMKNLPQAYNLDIQELTPLLWDSINQAKSSLKVMTKLVKKLKQKQKKIKKNAEKGFATLTELANSIVRKTEIPFRKAHEIVGKLASIAEKENKSLSELSIEDLYSASQKVLGEKIDFSEEEFEKSLDLDNCVKRKEMAGSPSPNMMKKELSDFESQIKEYENILEERKNSLKKSEKKLANLS